MSPSRSDSTSCAVPGPSKSGQFVSQVLQQNLENETAIGLFGLLPQGKIGHAATAEVRYFF